MTFCPSHNYHLIQPIREGGFGEVWSAETVTAKRRAVRIVKRERFEHDRTTDQEIDELFRLEFEGVQRFEDLAAQAPGLINIQHLGQNEQAGFYYYVMPLADNAGCESSDGAYLALNLERKIERDGAMNWSDAIDTVRQLAEGLGVLHRAGLCHGVVTSANVLSCISKTSQFWPIRADAARWPGLGHHQPGLFRSPCRTEYGGT